MHDRALRQRQLWRRFSEVHDQVTSFGSIGVDLFHKVMSTQSVDGQREDAGRQNG